MCVCLGEEVDHFSFLSLGWEDTNKIKMKEILEQVLVEERAIWLMKEQLGVLQEFTME